MILSVFFVLSAVVAGLFLWRDLRRADQRRRRRAILTQPATLRISADFTQFRDALARAMVPAVERMTAAMVEATAAATRLQRMIDELPRCRWCSLLARVGLSHHAAHYRPRHRAATR